jgi:hypothetical protein
MGMLIGVLFRSVLVMLGGVQRMAMGDFGMVGCFFMMPGLRMFGGFLLAKLDEWAANNECTCSAAVKNTSC